MPRCEVIRNVVAINHCNGSLQQLVVESNAKCCWPWVRDSDEGLKTDGAHDTDKTDILLGTERNCAVLGREKNGWIAGNGHFIDLRTSRVIEQDDGEVPEVKPCFVKGATPVVDEPINNCAAVQLRANFIKDDSSVNWKGLEGIFHNLEGMSMPKDRHAGVNLGIDRCRHTTHFNSDEVISWTC